jgi:phosphoglycerate dehydrogenase-like enzyme
MLLWKNTNFLDDYIQDMDIIGKPEMADVFLLNAGKVDLHKFQNLKAIFRDGVGDDNVPYDYLQKNNIKFGKLSKATKDMIYNEVSNFTCNLIFYMIYRGTHNMSIWEKEQRKFMGDTKLLIIGMGNIGKRVLDKMKNFMKVDCFDITKNNIKELSSKIQNADVITLHIPGQKNDNFFDKTKISKMKKNAILINTSRANVVNENDLYDGISKKSIYAAFDVFWEEPYKGKLMKFYPGRFYASPHVASTCDRVASGIAIDLKDFILNLDIQSKYYSCNFNKEIEFFVDIQDTNRSFFYRMCIDEYEHLKSEIGHPKKILDLGCGMGRSSIFLKNMLKLNNTKFYFADFNENKQYPKGKTGIPLGYHTNSKPQPFNSLKLTKQFCEMNNLNDLEMINLNTDKVTKLQDLNLIYSFYSVGYHFSIDKAFEKYDFQNTTTQDAIFIFGVRKPTFEIDTAKSKYLKLIKRIPGNVYQDFAIYKKRIK